ncbi:hypothetical protein D9619_006103 [Psilocybe cf. subviscida]|uniref:Non-specific serine/threonine protein kinase n=1 Tax=Psilocybe cf. subviscida TaxID=2480587 RepID=A0A8H5B4B3_9AGAR|nr:hypothetical protein D9619_006103 [Psilocybe cf. subviscida]
MSTCACTFLGLSLHTIMSIWGCIIDHDKTQFGNVFEVDCDSDLNISKLRTKVKDIASPDFEDVQAVDITVYHSPEIRADMDYKAAISELDLAKAEIPLAAVATEVASGYELLIFQMPAPKGESLKRPRSPSPEIDYLACLKRAKIVQESLDERLLDDRPEPDQKVAPIAPLYAPFGEFDDIFHGRVPFPDLNFARSEYRVNELAKAMSTSYESDHQRQRDGVYFLCFMFGHTLWGGDSRIHGMLTTIATCKNNLPAGPYVENVAHIARSHTRSDKFKDICSRWRVPALSIAIDVQFHAVLLLGHQYRAVSLTPGLSLSPSASNGWDRKQLYNAFAAAYVLQRRIHRDLDLYSQPSEPRRAVYTRDEYVLDIPKEFLPAVSKIREHGHDGDESNCKYVEFDIIDYLGPRLDYRHLYSAKVRNDAVTPDQDKFIIVKFSKSYSIDLHDFCAERGHAPKVFGYERLPGGWFAIAMEWLAEDAVSMKSHHYSSQREGLLVDLVNGFHEKDLVHGDLRYVNILCEAPSDKFWLIDFDWGGKAGEVGYPTWLLDGELVNGRESKDLVIRKEDDLRILRATLQWLQPT